MSLTSTAKLNNGVEIPWIGLGVFQSEPGAEAERAVRWALDIGYRHIDTAAVYRNEESVGKAIRDSRIDPESIFVTTKVWNSDQGYDETLAAFDESRKRLDRDVIDLYLVHWPVPGKYQDTWRALEKLYADKKVRAIGVSNFLEHHLEDLKSAATVRPALNQVEWHPFVLQKPLLDYCREQEIQFESWSPLTRGRRLDHPVIQDISQTYDKTPAQILIRWNLEHQVVTIPKSVREERILENSQVFDFTLAPEDVERLDALDEGERIGPHPDEIKA